MKAIRSIHNAERLNETASIVATQKLGRNSSTKILKLHNHWNKRWKHANTCLNPLFFRGVYIVFFKRLKLMLW